MEPWSQIPFCDARLFLQIGKLFMLNVSWWSFVKRAGWCIVRALFRPVDQQIVIVDEGLDIVP